MALSGMACVGIRTYELCMYLKCAIGWREWVQQRKRSIECMMPYLPLLFL